MSKLSLKTQQHGSTLNVCLSVMRVNNDNNNIISDPITANNMATVVVKCKGDGADVVQLSVGMKKSENAKMCSIRAKIIYEKFNHQFYLSDDWLEIIITNGKYDSAIDWNNSLSFYQYLYNIEVITVYEEMTTPVLANNQLYADQKITDFELCTTDGTVAVHKAVLFIHSDMFRTMLSGEWKETRENKIKIEGVTVQTLQHLKDYMYLGTLPDEGLEPLLVIAARYLMDKLKADCISKLVKTIKPENFDNIAQ